MESDVHTRTANAHVRAHMHTCRITDTSILITCMHARMHERTHARTHARMHGCMCVHVYIYIYIYIYIHTLMLKGEVIMNRQYEFPLGRNSGGPNISC